MSNFAVWDLFKLFRLKFVFINEMPWNDLALKLFNAFCRKKMRKRLEILTCVSSNVKVYVKRDVSEDLNEK